MSTFIVLRHALAGDRAEWGSGDRSRPLSREGFQQSLALLEQLDGLPIDQVMTSPFVRCQHTVAPLAAVRRLAVIEAQWLAEGATSTAVRAGLASVDGDTLLCTHGDLVGVILDEIGIDSHLTTGGLELDKAAALVLRLEGRTVVDVVHVPAPVAGRDVETVQSVAI